jgi:hypothetical protein
MRIMDINALLQKAAQIRDEQSPRANSASRVGELLYAMVEAQNNDTIESGPYIVSQEGIITGAPYITAINTGETLIVPPGIEYTLSSLSLDGDMELNGNLNLM